MIDSETDMILVPCDFSSSLFPPQLPIYNLLFWLSMPNALQQIKLTVSALISFADLSSVSNKMPSSLQCPKAIWAHSWRAVLAKDALLLLLAMFIVFPSVFPLENPRLSFIFIGYGQALTIVSKSTSPEIKSGQPMVSRRFSSDSSSKVVVCEKWKTDTAKNPLIINDSSPFSSKMRFLAGAKILIDRSPFLICRPREFQCLYPATKGFSKASAFYLFKRNSATTMFMR